jgi:hypothetical protein
MTEYAGYLLYWDHDLRRDRLLIGFRDMDVNDPVWLPAAQVRVRLEPRLGRVRHRARKRGAAAATART